MTFNIIARNQDEPLQNIAFLMDKAGRWSLAPDSTHYQLQPERQLDRTINDDEWQARRITLADFRGCAKTASPEAGGRRPSLRKFRSAFKWRTTPTGAKWRRSAQADPAKPPTGIPRT